jgi:2-dehydro-3-deoxygalactonokinase
MTPEQRMFIGIDWGTTHRRAVLLGAAGEVLAQQHDDQGALACAGRFGPALQALLAAWPQAESAPVVMAGMVGSAAGWQEVPYLDAATPLGRLGRHLAPLRDAPAGRPCFIVPGVCFRGERGQVDVMRGEETQLLGAMQLLGTYAGDGWYVLPGTHSKWVRLQGGAVTALRTYMSGELFALLGERGTLAALMHGAEPDGQSAAFERALAELGDEALSHALFGVRARVVTGTMPAAEARAYVSGVLLGAEWRDLRRHARIDGPVRLIGEPGLVRLHQQCARHAGIETQALDGQHVQLAAWQALKQSLEAQA